jgi:hypothetical protein
MLIGQDLHLLRQKHSLKIEKEFTIDLRATNEFISKIKSQRSGEINEVPFIDEALNPKTIKASFFQMHEEESMLSFKIEEGNMSGFIFYQNDGVRGSVFINQSMFIIEPVSEGKHKMTLLSGANYDCEVVGSDGRSEPRTGAKRMGNNTIRTYRIAAMVTGEYSDWRLDDLTTINNDLNLHIAALNTLFDREIGIRFTRVGGNNLIFTDPLTDGINPSANASSRLNAVHTAINNVLGSSGFDVGFGTHYITGNGSGVAGLGVTCNNSFKGRCWTQANSLNTAIQLNLHEVGHQFGADHTFYGTAANCVNRSLGHGYEPGSGSTIMSYEGLCFEYASCPSQNITPAPSSTYFHNHSLSQIQSHFLNPSNACFTSSSIGNDVPIISMPVNKTIPKNTPFRLEGSATDNNKIYYNWEEYDTDLSTPDCNGGAPNSATNSTTAPLFRSYDPTPKGNVRIFPKLNDILTNTQVMGEILPSVSRNMKFRLTARDLKGGLEWAEVTISVDQNAGPFEITSQNSAASFTGGQTVSVTWSVNNTNLAPISCSQVNIYFSIDGGKNFIFPLASNTSNDGSETVTIPNITTSKGRIMVEAAGNYFFDINNADLSVSGVCTPVESFVLNDSLRTFPIGSTSLILNPSALNPISNISMNISGTSAIAARTTFDSNNTCVNTGSSRYVTFSFRVAESGEYAFVDENVSIFKIISLYANSFNTADLCQNFINSDKFYNGSSYSYFSPPTNRALLSSGTTYVLRLSSNTAGTYNIPFSGNGSILSNTLALPANTSYSFVIVQNSTGIIKGLNTNADLSSSTIFTGGDYKVYGISHPSTNNLSSYINGSFSTLIAAIQSAIVCATLSNNFIPVKITGGCTPGTKTVTSSLDNSTAGTLRAALTGVCPGDNIVFSLPSNTIITLSSQINITSIVNVDGSGVTNLILSGNNTNRIFNINSGASLSLKNIKLINAVSSSNGGAILNSGILNLTGGVIFDNNFEGATPKSISNPGRVNITNSGNRMEN